MATPKKRHYDYWILGLIMVGSAALAVVLSLYHTDASIYSSATPTPSTGSSSSIPTSVPEAKTYISRAAEKANSGDYQSAKTILSEAIVLFPDDLNLKLTLEYYENQDKRAR